MVKTLIPSRAPTGPRVVTPGMRKTVTATEAKNRFGTVIKEAQNTPVIIESRGVEQAVIVSVEDFRELEAFREAERRRRAVERLERRSAELAEINATLPDEVAQILIRETIDETMQSMVDRGLIRFEE